jgi:glycosyltransferase involved in cell wall biosynthesis
MANNLVSVIVVTFNSSSFITETLESVYKQSWSEIELIITDDCSDDDTVEICRNWLIKCKERFVKTEIVLTGINTGVPANANRGLRAAKGDWLVFLAGDDTLKSSCIEDNMSWIATHPEIKVLFSYIEVYRDTIKPESLLYIIPRNPFSPDSIMAPGRSAESQYKILLTCDRINFTPSIYLHRETLISVGGYDERFRLLEDHPLWLNLTRSGFKLHFMDKVTVNYRMHSMAINNNGMSFVVNPNYFVNEDFRKVYTYPNLPVDIRLNVRFHWYASQVFRCKLLNQDKIPFRALYTFLTVLINPFRYFIWLKKKLYRDLKNSEFYL